jgi:hypothetical protein
MDGLYEIKGFGRDGLPLEFAILLRDLSAIGYTGEGLTLYVRGLPSSITCMINDENAKKSYEQIVQAMKESLPGEGEK